MGTPALSEAFQGGEAQKKTRALEMKQFWRVRGEVEGCAPQRGEGENDRFRILLLISKMCRFHMEKWKQMDFIIKVKPFCAIASICGLF